jgi:hypothetical protein
MSSISDSLRKLRGSFMKAKKKDWLDEVKAMQPQRTVPVAPPTMGAAAWHR